MERKTRLWRLALALWFSGSDIKMSANHPRAVPLMVIGHLRRFAFISTPKCATNSLVHLLITKYGGEMPGELHDRRMELVPPGYFTFSVCRNPYSRAVSIWWSTCRRNDRDRYGFRRACREPDSFEGFMEWMISPEAPMHALLLTQCEWHRKTRIDQFLKIEHLTEEFCSLPFVDPKERVRILNATVTTDHARLDLDRLKQGGGESALSSVNQHSRVHTREYLTPRAVSLVQMWAAADFERFGYSADPKSIVDFVDSRGLQ